MSEQYNENYYSNYCGSAYEDSKHWTKFFGNIADHIVADFQPSSVLDAGCAMGYLVEALRDRGVEAYGIDISSYAISKVRDDVRPFCCVGSLTKPLPESLPQHFDLVVTIEVLEHLYAVDSAKAIFNLCKITDKIIFTSTPDSFTDRTHLNVQQREYWARLFAEQGFYDDIRYRPKYITNYAVCYRKTHDTVRLVEDYERELRITEQELQDKDQLLIQHIKLVQERDETIQQYISTVQERDETILQHIAMVHERDLKIQEYLSMVKDRDKTIEQHITMIRERNETIAQQIVMIQEKDQMIAERNKKTDNQQREIEKLKKELRECTPFWKRKKE